MIESVSVDENVMEKIRESDEYQKLWGTLESKYDEISEGTSRAYRTDDQSDDEYIVAIDVQVVGESNKVSFVFRLDGNDAILHAEATVDNIGGQGEARKVDEFFYEEGEESIRINSYTID